MTITEFLAELEKAKDKLDWCLMQNRIRGRTKKGLRYTHCPLTAVLLNRTDKDTSCGSWLEASYSIGLNYTDTVHIKESADNFKCGDTRNAMLNSLGLPYNEQTHSKT